MAKIFQLIENAAALMQLRDEAANAQIIVKLSEAFGVSIETANKMFKRYGPDSLYALNGRDVSIDTPNARKCMSESGFVEIKNGNVVVHRSRRKSHAAHRPHKGNAMQARIRRERAEMFAGCQTNPSPKRQGKANSLDDIGKYVSHYKREISVKSGDVVYANR